MSKQLVECYKSNDSFDKVECCLDIVAENGKHCCQKRQQCRSNIRLVDLIENTKFYDKLVDTVAVFGNRVESCFDKVERCFYIVAGVDGA